MELFLGPPSLVQGALFQLVLYLGVLVLLRQIRLARLLYRLLDFALLFFDFVALGLVLLENGHFIVENRFLVALSVLLELVPTRNLLHLQLLIMRLLLAKALCFDLLHLLDEDGLLLDVSYPLLRLLFLLC